MLKVVAALIHLDGKLLICQRRADDASHPLKWEFPGGKVKPDESHSQALIRELQEELGIQALEMEFICSYPFQYQGKNPLELHFYFVHDYLGLIKNRQFAKLLWIDSAQIKTFDFLAGDEVIVEKIFSGEIIIPDACTGCIVKLMN
ncbi:MAG TPA: (deoxy)nucleoside triphosphate pyrophosphohydrolase [Candidatus Marinimicrobia bacterium]|nr:(deoxy)nucleoside triphosphate pyrophosphohydrolase [Candidatus Neomarinimicrobiota bacterium]